MKATYIKAIFAAAFAMSLTACASQESLKASHERIAAYVCVPKPTHLRTAKDELANCPYIGDVATTNDFSNSVQGNGGSR